MSTTTSNNRALQPVTADTVQKDINEARRCHGSSKDSATEAVAWAYMIWRDALSEHADPSARTWLMKQIDDRNTEIDAHNKVVQANKQRAEDYKNNDLKARDPILRKPANEAEAAEIEKEKAALQKLASRTKAEWDAERRVRVEGRAGQTDFTLLAKFTFEFDRVADASLTSRYVQVLKWIGTKFDDKEVNSTEEIVIAIKAFGGFEDVIHSQRGGLPNDSEPAEDRLAIAKAITKETNEAINAADSKTSVPLEIANAKNVVMLLGRYSEGNVEVVSTKALKEDELDRWVGLFELGGFAAPPDNTEFVARVLALGELVAEGRVTELTRNDLKMGEKLREERAFSLLPNDETGAEFVVSARHADASVVVKARPKSDRVNLGKPVMPVSMATPDLVKLHRMIGEERIRSLVSIELCDESGDANAGPGWTVSNRALVEAESPNAAREFLWEDMSSQEYKPLDVEFRSQFYVHVAKADLVNLYDKRLAEWGTKKGDPEASKKAPKLVTLSFGDKTVTCKIEGAEDLPIPCSDAKHAPMSLNFRPRDLHDLVLALTRQDTETFAFSVDGGGPLRVSWTDELATYDVYQPTATNDGRLRYSRLSPMSVNAPVSDEIAA